MTACTTCGGKARLLGTKRTEDQRFRRRYHCEGCGNRWAEITDHPLPTGHRRKLDEAAIRDILTSGETSKAIAKRYSCAYSMVSAIRRGLFYADVAQELPRHNCASCSFCLHWAGPERCCDLDFPEPQIEGQWFARECSAFARAAA